MTKYVLSTLLVIGATGLSGQVSKEGTPLSWDALAAEELTLISEELQPLDVPYLLQEDNASIGLKTQPYRFASAQMVEYSTAHDGEWRNLGNGDRIWLFSVTCPNALALSVEFSHLNIPDGATVYIYNQDRTDFLGPLTHLQKRLNRPFGTVPIGGNTIVIEYYEPFAKRGLGELVISSVARSYRDVNVLPVFPGNDCVRASFNSDADRDLTEAVLLLLMDRGQRAISGTLVNNSRHDGQPYVVTALQGLVGDPTSWVFVHGVSQSCPSGELCWDRFVSGAEVLREDGKSGMALLRLLESPNKKWNAYMAGWSLNEPGNDQYTCLQHAYAARQTVARFQGSPQQDQWSAFSTIRIDQWDSGNTFSGSLGSPLFNSYGELVGVLVGGQNTCGQSQGDHFGSLAEAWTLFRNFLDPFSANFEVLPGFYPVYDRRPDSLENESDLVVFPNPTSDKVSIQNNSDEAILEVILRDSSGRICRNWFPNVPMFDVNGLAAGHYILTIRQPSVTSHRNLIVR